MLKGFGVDVLLFEETKDGGGAIANWVRFGYAEDKSKVWLLLLEICMNDLGAGENSVRIIGENEDGSKISDMYSVMVTDNVNVKRVEVFRKDLVADWITRKKLVPEKKISDI